jgi:hypothetical protein
VQVHGHCIRCEVDDIPVLRGVERHRHRHLFWGRGGVVTAADTGILRQLQHTVSHGCIVIESCPLLRLSGLEHVCSTDTHHTAAVSVTIKTGRCAHVRRCSGCGCPAAQWLGPGQRKHMHVYAASQCPPPLGIIQKANISVDSARLCVGGCPPVIYKQKLCVGSTGVIVAALLLAHRLSPGCGHGPACVGSAPPPPPPNIIQRVNI